MSQYNNYYMYNDHTHTHTHTHTHKWMSVEHFKLDNEWISVDQLKETTSANVLPTVYHTEANRETQF